MHSRRLLKASHAQALRATSVAQGFFIANLFGILDSINLNLCAMADKIFLNDEVLSFHEDDLPCLITYVDKTGGSHFSITLVVDLFLRGSKILFLTAYPMAKDNFLQQVGSDHSKIAFVTSIEDLENVKNTQVIILESGNEALFSEVAKMLPDLAERVILVKNMEVFSKVVFDICLNMKRVILSGNIGVCRQRTHQ